MYVVSRRITEVVAANRGHGWLRFAGGWHAWDEVAELAAEFRGSGSDDATRTVGVVTGNSSECATAIVASLMAESTVIILDAMMADDDLRDVAGGYPIDRLLSSPEDGGRLPRITNHGGRLRHSTTARSDTQRDEVVAIDLGTSGTTGPPKRFQMMYGQLEDALLQTRRHIYGTGEFGSPVARRSVSIIHTPLSHVGGMYRLIDNVAEPRPTLLMAKFEPYEWADLVEQFSVRVDGLNPTAIQMVLETGIEPARLRSLRAVRCGMAPLREDVRDAFEGRYEVAVLRAYGATEFSGEVAGWTLAEYRELKDVKRGSVGRIHDGVQARLVDESGNVLDAPGASGRLQLRSRRIGEGADWVTTSDIARIDADRYLWIQGRADAAINRGGFKIVPEQVAEVIKSHPSVADVAVVGIDNQRLGQIVAAAVVVAPGSTLTEADLRAWCRDRLPHFMTPEAVIFPKELPLTRSLKVDHGKVKLMVEQSLARRQTT
jgi:acyl-coenzyme A synthetase/AMP-(fatty) acid ligase